MSNNKPPFQRHLNYNFEKGCYQDEDGALYQQYHTPDGCKIFGEDSPHDIGEHLAKVCKEQPDECRRIFEKWAASKQLPTLISEHFINTGAYSHADTHVAWLAWQAAWGSRPGREAVTPTESDFLADVIIKRIRAWARSESPATVIRCEMDCLLKGIDDPRQFKVHFDAWLRTDGITGNWRRGSNERSNNQIPLPDAPARSAVFS